MCLVEQMSTGKSTLDQNPVYFNIVSINSLHARKKLLMKITYIAMEIVCLVAQEANNSK